MAKLSMAKLRYLRLLELREYAASQLLTPEYFYLQKSGMFLQQVCLFYLFPSPTWFNCLKTEHEGGGDAVVQYTIFNLSDLSINLALKPCSRANIKAKMAKIWNLKKNRKNSLGSGCCLILWFWHLKGATLQNGAFLQISSQIKFYVP